MYVEEEEYQFDHYDDDSVDKSSISTIDSYERKYSRLPKIVDNGCHSFTLVRNGVRTSIKLYTTKYTPGSRIRNAETGIYENDLVGRSGEYNYFKVSLSGELGQNPQSKHLYYDSPQQYEKHFQIIIDSKIKDKFNQKNNVI
jgi:hypothetical protein